MSQSAVSVALCTYNGARYLQQQLDSLLAQELLPAELVVGDDGSTDDTLGILERFAAQAPFPVRVTRNAINLGFGENFLQAADRCRYEYIAFCDQDDVWSPRKLAAAVAGLQRPGVALVLQRAMSVDGQLGASDGIWPLFLAPGEYPAGGLYGLQVWPGFLMTFNARLIRDFSFAGRPLFYCDMRMSIPHDAWVLALAMQLSTLVVLPEVAALYRRHDGTVTGDNLDRRSLAEKIDYSLAVLPETYRNRADCAAALGRRLAAMGERAPALARARRRYDRLADVLYRRAELVGHPRMLDRLGIFVRLLLSGGYVRPRMSALPPRSIVKDAVVAVLGRGGAS